MSSILCCLTPLFVDAAETPSKFEEAIEPYLKQHCVRCHGKGLQEGDFRIDKLSHDVGNGPDVNRWFEVIEKINNGEMPPADVPNRPTAEQGHEIVTWLVNRIREGEAARLAQREKVSFHRLTRDEYADTIEDLLGVRFGVADPNGLTEDGEWHGFKRLGTVQNLSASHIEKYFFAAERILEEAYPEQPVPREIVRKRALDLRGGPTEAQIAELEAQGLADKVRVDLWPGHRIQGGRPGPGRSQMFKNGGQYKVRLQLSGLKPADGRAPHLTFYAEKIDRMLFEQDIVAPEDKPVIVEFTTHLPAGGHGFEVMNDVPGPSVLPRSGRAGRAPFFSLEQGRIPWQLKLTDEAGLPLYPFLILDWIEWEGPIISDDVQRKRDAYLPPELTSLEEARPGLALFLERAFRRPVSEAEVDRYMHLAEGEVEAGSKLRPALKTAMLAILCAKDFLFVVEGSPDRETNTLDDWQLASRLSYFLWGTMPDDELFERAREGRLHEREVLQAQVNRMLADPRAAGFTTEFPREWLQLQKVGMFPPDSQLYPEYDKYLERSMIDETTSFFAEVLHNNLTLREFITSDWTMVNPRLALHYGIPLGTEDSFQRVTLGEDSHRGGLLTQAAVLSLTSDGTRHRPVHRGVWVLESILGQSPPPPPANVEPIEPNPVDSPKATVRMKLDAHKHDANCAACHRKIDPLGLAFDNFDAIGRWRTVEKVPTGQGADPPVDASGQLPDGRSFHTPDEFKQLLLDDLDAFNRTFIKKLAMFGLRRTMTVDDYHDLDTLAAESRNNDYRLRDLVVNLVLSDLFQKR